MEVNLSHVSFFWEVHALDAGIGQSVGSIVHVLGQNLLQVGQPVTRIGDLVTKQLSPCLLVQLDVALVFDPKHRTC